MKEFKDNNSYYQIFSYSVLQFIIVIYTKMNNVKKILYESISVN